MYQNSNGCSCGLGGDAASTLIPLAAAAFGGPAAGAAAGAVMGSGGGGGGGGMMPQQTTVSPQISTQISPQISPVFQQQFQPKNSAATAGTSQMLPSMPAMTGADGSGMVPGGVGMPGYAQPVTPGVPSVPADYTRYLPYALGGIALVVAYKIFASKKKAA